MSKPVWPYPDIVTMTPHRNGQWCKKIRGKLHYFGTEPDAALAQWRQVGADLLAGRQPQTTTGEVTVGGVFDLYIQDRHAAMVRGDLAQRTLGDYAHATSFAFKSLGGGRPVVALSPSDFTRLYNELSERYGTTRRGNMVGWIRLAFNWAYQEGIIENPVRFGTTFKRSIGKPTKLAFTPPQIHALLSAASVPMRAMILLGLNGGLGNTDCAELPLHPINLIDGTLDYARVKNDNDRFVPLWRETVYALIDAIEHRPTPRDPAYRDHVFLTWMGHPWVRGIGKDAIGQEFNKLTKQLGIARQGLGFYTLRRTFRTVADATGDQRACDAIMGHAYPGMGTRYVAEIGRDRLEHVVNHVRAWLYSRAHRTTRAS